MNLQEFQQQALKLSITERWQLVQSLLFSLEKETHTRQRKSNLSRFRGIAKGKNISSYEDTKGDYADYLTEKYK